MIIKHPETAHIPQLRCLWQEAFGDSDSFLDAFFSAAFTPQRCLTLWEDDRLAAAAYWLDSSCRGDPCAYLYAIATAKVFRGRGFCHRLMDFAHGYLRRKGYVMTVLVPGESSLYGFYTTMGYRPFGGIREEFFSTGKTAAPLEALTGEAYFALRSAFVPEGSLLPGKETVDFLGTQAHFYRGEGFLFCAQPEKDTLFVPEYLGNGDPGAILHTLGCREGTFRRPGTEPFALWLPLRDTPAPEYFSFALD